MRPKTLISLSIIFVVLGSYVYFFELNSTDEVQSVPEPDKLITVDPKEVEQVRLKTEDDLFVFGKTDQNWMMTSPVRQDVMDSRVETLFSVFDYAYIREISADPTDLSIYGLDEPEIEFGFRLKGENAFTTLQIGDNSPYGINCYATFEHEPEVFLVGLLYKQVLDQNMAFFKTPP
ncbi:MAG: DUF4340 domain-containing protein [Desulfobacterales bacterium]